MAKSLVRLELDIWYLNLQYSRHFMATEILVQELYKDLNIVGFTEEITKYQIY